MQFSALLIVHLSSFLITIGVVQGQTQCNPANETLLQIESNGRSLDQVYIEVVHPISFLPKDTLVFLERIWSLEVCIPSEECVVARVSRRDYDAQGDLSDVVITNDGVAVELAQEHFYFTAPGGSYFINCDPPTCADGESPLDLTILTNSAFFLTWRVDDLEGNVIFDYCQEQQDHCSTYSRYDYVRPRICLPVSNNECYRLVAGENNIQNYVYNNDLSGDEFPSIFNVSFGNDILASWTNLQYESVQFGSDQCENGGSTRLSCGTEESFLEVFFERPFDMSEVVDMSWQIIHHGNSSNGDADTILADGSFVHPMESRSPLYLNECVPADSCITFKVSVPEDTVNITVVSDLTNELVNGTYLEFVRYRVLLDDVIYADAGADSFISFGGSNFDPLEERIYEIAIGTGECSTDQLCAQSGPLLDVQFETGSFSNNANDYFYSDVSLYSHGPLIAETLPFQKYRLYECFPVLQDSCLEFFVSTTGIKNGVIKDNYIVTLDGEIQSGRFVCDDETDPSQFDCQGLTLTPVGERGCPRRGTSGATSAMDFTYLITIIFLTAASFCVV